MRGKIATVAVVGLLLLLLWKRGADLPERLRAEVRGSKTKAGTAQEYRSDDRWVRTSRRTTARSPEEIVQAKLAKYGKSRRELALALATKHGVSMTPEVEAFFAAVQSGDWERIEKTFTVLNGGSATGGDREKRSLEANKMWPAILDAFGAAEQVHLLPAQTLLDYGHGILDALRPGMVYVGGTDSSRWVPALLNDTEAGDRHVVITQNALADLTYLDYVELQFSDRLNTLTPTESDRDFNAYMEDARKRLEHDQKFPGEPKQIRPGEEVKIVNGKVNVSGQVAVFDINERLLSRLMDKNPELSFAVGESFPLKGTYADAVPLGPLMELRANAKENFTPERASGSVEYWRNTAQEALADPDTASSESGLKTYSHDAVAAAHLLAAHSFHQEAEEAYNIARKLWPSNPETVTGLADLYRRTGREGEADRLLQQFASDHPTQGVPR
jgi:hypothetical protein